MGRTSWRVMSSPAMAFVTWSLKKSTIVRGIRSCQCFSMMTFLQEWMGGREQGKRVFPVSHCDLRACLLLFHGIPPELVELVPGFLVNMLETPSRELVLQALVPCDRILVVLVLVLVLTLWVTARRETRSWCVVCNMRLEYLAVFATKERKRLQKDAVYWCRWILVLLFCVNSLAKGWRPESRPYNSALKTGMCVCVCV